MNSYDPYNLLGARQSTERQAKETASRYRVWHGDTPTAWSDEPAFQAYREEV